MSDTSDTCAAQKDEWQILVRVVASSPIVERENFDATHGTFERQDMMMEPIILHVVEVAVRMAAEFHRADIDALAKRNPPKGL